ncbi:DUF481 domain-containing protein [Flavihumibacter rivuli]|uniref:DUF481 domain-containing protein n=1 Tax=Flavihumibacter rivuli TaxID=2838156 RepID=UPI001BDDF4B1|nr:DUF481 domain-containing protein [Flavihumibacter rivuli]ULQ56812.1 DUF481 domain-containing protein [Flavihumibacter rivuli]
MTKRILFILILFLPLVSAAQLTETDTLPFGYRLTANGSWITGNVERLLLIGTADLYTVHEQWAFRTANTYQYGTIAKNLTENDLFSRNFFYLHPRQRFYPYLMAWVETNKRREIALRYQYGPGISWAALSKQDNQLKLSFTLTYESAEYSRNNFGNSRYDNDPFIETFRGTIRVYGQHRLLNNKLKFRYECWGQQSFEDRQNYRLHGEFALELPLTSMTSFRVGYNYNYESIVLEGIKKRDGFLLFGIAVANFK